MGQGGVGVSDIRGDVALVLRLILGDHYSRKSSSAPRTVS